MTNRNETSDTLTAMLITQLMNVQQAIGHLEATTLGNRRAAREQMENLRQLFNARIDDLKSEVFHRFIRQDTSLEKVNKRVTRLERRPPTGHKGWTISSLLSIGKQIWSLPWGQIMLIGWPLALGLIGITSPAQTKAALLAAMKAMATFGGG